jgi:hypothetical protein
MKKFIGVGYGALSDSEMLSLSYEGPIFKGLDDVRLGPLRAGVKERAQLKEREAKAEVLAQNGAYAEAEEIERKCSKVRAGLAAMQAEFEKGMNALRLAKVRRITTPIPYYLYPDRHYSLALVLTR